MGHFVLGHVFTGVLLSCLLNLIGLWFLHVVSGRILASKRWLRSMRVDRLSDVASLPLLLLLGELFFLTTSPLSYAVSRHQEHEADRFALEITRANHSCGMAFVKLQRDNRTQTAGSAGVEGQDKLLSEFHKGIRDRAA